MWDIFKAELLRFRYWAIAFAFIHLLVLAFMSRLVDLAQQPLLVYRVFGAVYGLAGLLLGLYQMGSYRRPSMWLQLLHRPLPTWKIAVALCAASALLLAVAVALPIAIIATWQETLTARVVDMRHWLMPLAVLLIALSSYLAGCYCMLGGRRYSVCALVLLVLFLVSHASGLHALLIQLLVLAWLACMVLTAFKPDLSAPPQGALAGITSAMPLQMTLYLSVLLVFLGFEMLWVMQGTHPNNTPTPPVGGHNEVEKMDDKSRMLKALSASTSPDAPLLREQIGLSEIQGIGSQIYTVPMRNAFTNRAPMEFDDNARRVRWVFSHDSMRFEGYSLVDRRAVGVFGIGKQAAPFPALAMAAGSLPSLAEGDNVLIAGNALYHYDSELGTAIPRIRLPAGEILMGASAVGESLGVLSDRAVYFFNVRDLIDNDELLVPRQRVPLPGLIGDLRDMEIIELVDGYLLDFSFSAKAHEAFGGVPYQQVLRVDDAGHVERIARRGMSYDYPAIYRYKSWWVSPALYVLREQATQLLGDPQPLERAAAASVPRSMVMLAGLLGALSLLCAAWLTRHRALSPPARMAWIIVCGVIGIPALLSLWLMYPKRECVPSMDAAIAQQASA